VSPETPGQSFNLDDGDEVLAQEQIDVTPAQNDAQKDDIRIEYHPKSGRVSTTVPFGEFKREEADRNRAPADDTPWRLFGSRVNFEFAELTHQSLMNQGQIDALIKLIRRCIDLGIDSPEAFTLDGAKELSNIWTLAAETITPFNKKTIHVPYKQKDVALEVWSRPILNWATDLLHDPNIAPSFVWDAQRLSKFDGSRFVRFIDEPWTADDFWDVQVCLN